MLTHGTPLMRGHKMKKTVRLSRKYDKYQEKWNLGDLVAKVANPVAKGLDVLFGTNIYGCKGCDTRREWLNKLMGKK
jgi:hypothetical protein